MERTVASKARLLKTSKRQFNNRSSAAIYINIPSNELFRNAADCVDVR